MKFGKLHSDSDRSAAIILLITLSIIAVGCILGMAYLFEYHFYEKGDNGETARNVAVQIYSMDDTELAKDYYNYTINDKDSHMVKYYKDKFSRDNSNFAFVITETVSGKVCLNSTDSGGDSFEELKAKSKYTGKSNFYITDENGNIVSMTLNYAIVDKEDQQASDKYTLAFRWINAANYLKNFLFIVLFLVVLVIVILLTLLAINAGTEDEENGEIIPGFIDKLPLDFCTVVFVLLFVVAWIIINLTSAAAVDMVLNNVVVVITCVIAVIVTMTYLNTLSVRVKMGKIHKNTVIYRIYRKFKRKTSRNVRRKISSITFFEKMVVCIILFFLIEAAILITLAYFGVLNETDNSRSVMLIFIVVWGITRLILIPIVAMIAINLNYVKEEGQRLAEGILGDEIASKLSISSIRAHGKHLDSIKKEINKAVEQELKSERLRNELITNVSHDIKTPLTSIRSYIDFLQRDDLTEEQRKEYLAIVVKHTDKLTYLTNNLMEVSQITSGNIEVKREKTSLNIIIEQTLDEFALKLEQSELLPRVNIPEEDVFIMGDGEWLWRIFSNLFNNACKYAAPGTDLEISVDENDGKAVVSISNLSKTSLNIEGDELFERFVRGDSSRHTEGNGLGLSIAKSLVELQGGTLDISVREEKFAAVMIFDIAE
ncbi:MAG: HAMP domain-containing histidine kinase [Ruminococcaceae bacterium]|nr:HAMP domain-containing histidine kinase [Oscillospiraceae bacterium]